MEDNQTKQNKVEEHVEDNAQQRSVKEDQQQTHDQEDNNIQSDIAPAASSQIRDSQEVNKKQKNNKAEEVTE